MKSSYNLNSIEKIELMFPDNIDSLTNNNLIQEKEFLSKFSYKKIKLIPSFIILGFIFFVDFAGKYVQKNLPQLSLITVSAKLISLSLFPLALATVITLVAVEFPIN
mgnify:CR=1 FL=1